MSTIELLSRYGRHDRTCPLHFGPNRPGDELCTCGFSAALARVEEPRHLGPGEWACLGCGAPLDRMNRLCTSCRENVEDGETTAP